MFAVKILKTVNNCNVKVKIFSFILQLLLLSIKKLGLFQK